MPANADETRLRILQVAEQTFASEGFDVSLRTIATRADMHLSLVRYHFGTKDELYRAVWGARYDAAADDRNAALAKLDINRDRTSLVRDLVRLFMAPAVMMQDKAGRNFMTLMARELVDRREPLRGILNELVDRNAQTMLKAFARALPELSPAQIGWGYQSMTGVGVMHILDVDRTTRLSKGAARSLDYASAYPELVEFITAGWLGLVRRAEQHEVQPGKPMARAGGRGGSTRASKAHPR
jgi:AcrR family transcriptional regulator